MSRLPPESSKPELVIGLVAPIGVELDALAETIEAALEDVRYSATTIRLTELMSELGLEKTKTTYIDSYNERIDQANEVRKRFGDEAMAALAISAIRSFRARENPKRRETGRLTESGDLTDQERPLASQAYILRQLKHPKEIKLLRQVYGRQFILISAYAPETLRLRRIEDKEKTSRRGLADELEVKAAALALVRRDSHEQRVRHGQHVSDAFPLGDVFVDASTRVSSETAVRRFVNLLFGDNQITPTHDEYGMYLAKSASLRSSDLSRQVGVAIFRSSGEILTLGCNEVPRAGGGTYWSEDANDGRDFQQGYDPNDRFKNEVLVDIIDRLKTSGHLSKSLQAENSIYNIMSILLQSDSDKPLSESRVMGLIEFGRIIHAEMSAITDAARKGISLQNSTLYSTTFPCHLCAKHVVSAGITRVVYIEPYPKSYASELHGDSIAIDEPGVHGKVSFEAYLGVSPFRYRDLFEKGKRKVSGVAQRWNRGEARPLIEVYYPSYSKSETYVVNDLNDEIEKANVQSQAAT